MMQLPNRDSSKSHAYTLLEVMIASALVMMIAAIMTPMLVRAKFKSYHTACIQNERNLATALHLYSLENEQLYPEELKTLTVPPRPFIKEITTCPSDHSSYVDGYTTRNDNKEYLLVCPGQHHVQLSGLVDQGYPQINTGMLRAFSANR